MSHQKGSTAEGKEMKATVVTLLRWSTLLAFLSLVILSGCRTPEKSKPPEELSATPAYWIRPRFSPNGTRLAAMTKEGGVFEFALPGDLVGSQVKLPFDPAKERLIDLAYNAEGDLLVLCQLTNVLTLWNAQQGIALARRPLHASFLGGCLSPDAQQAVLCFEATPGLTNLTLALIDLCRGGEIISLPKHRNVVSLSLSRDGKRLGTVDGDGLARVWNSQTGTLLLTLPGKIMGIDLDERGDIIAVLGSETRIHHFDQLGSQPAAKISNPAPKATTSLGGVGAIMLGLAVNAPPQGSAYWFKAQPPLGISLSKDGKRVAFMNCAPNLKGGYEVRLADAESGRVLEARSLPLKFVPSGKPILSSDGAQVAVPGNGVYLVNFKSTNSWLAEAKKPRAEVRPDRHEVHWLLPLEPVPSTNSTSCLARSSHRRVCFEATTFMPENQT
jgi:WD40 repeat protein